MLLRLGALRRCRGAAAGVSSTVALIVAAVAGGAGATSGVEAALASLLAKSVTSFGFFTSSSFGNMAMRQVGYVTIHLARYVDCS